MTPLRSLALFGGMLALLCATGLGQTLSAPDQTNSVPTEQKSKGDEQRVFGVVPQFSVTNESNAPPLTGGEKFKLFERTSFDPFNFASAGLQAALSQATDEFPQYGEGAVGYGKRYAASFADQVSSNFFANYFYSSLLKEDPRYFRLGSGTIKRRMVYALEQEFVVHKDTGSKTFAFENILGAFTSGTLSNAYYPSNDRGFGLTVSRSIISILYGSAGGLFSEFSPDLQRLLFHKRNQDKVVIRSADH